MIIKKKINNLKNKAFTLVELLVVISIMGILTVVVSASFHTIQMKARDAKRKSDLDSIAKAVNMYFADYGNYPGVGGTSPNLDTLLSTSGSEFSHTGIVYMKELPTEKTIGIEPYRYTIVDSNLNGNTGRSFRLYAELENTDDSGCLADTVDCPYIDAYCCYGVSSPNISMEGDMI